MGVILGVILGVIPDAQGKLTQMNSCFPVMGVIPDKYINNYIKFELLPRYGGYS